MALEARLSRVQRWMQEVVVHPGSIDEALASKAARAEIPPERLADVVLPKKRSPSVNPPSTIRRC